MRYGLSFFIELAYNSLFLCKFAKYNQYDSDMNKIRYINMCIVEFGKKFSMPADIAFNYLKQYKALAFLDKCYEAEHQLSLADTISCGASSPQKVLPTCSTSRTCGSITS